MGYDVVCIGSAVVDTYFSISKCFSQISAGDKILTQKHSQNSGGGAINSARVLAKMGHKVAILSKIGDDHNGDIITKELKEIKISFLTKTKARVPTDSSSIVSSDKDKDRVIFVSKGASGNLTEKDIPKKILKKTKWIYLATVIGKSESLLRHIVANSTKTNVLFNPSHYLASLGTKKLKIYLQATSVLILNKKEAMALLHTTTFSIPKMLQSIIRFGPKIVIITNGDKTLFCSDGTTMYSITPPKIKVVHTAGAGDAFNAGFLSGLLHKRTVEYSLQIGLACATSMIQYIGTNKKLLTFQEAEKMVQKYKMKVKKHNVR